MLPINIAGEHYEVPTNWSEVTMNQYVQLCEVAGDSYSAAAILCPFELKSLQLTGLAQLFTVLSFIDGLAPPIDLDHEYKSLKISAESFRKLDLSRNALRVAKTPLHGLLKVGKIYTDKDFETMPVTEAMPILTHLYEGIKAFMEKYKRLQDYKHDVITELSNPERFNRFGSLTTVDALAKGDVSKWGEVWNMSAGQVYEKLLLDFEQSEFQKDAQKNAELIRKAQGK